MLGMEGLENGNLCLDWNGDVIKGRLTVCKERRTLRINYSGGRVS